jgi:hypothetical protein
MAVCAMPSGWSTRSLVSDRKDATDTRWPALGTYVASHRTNYVFPRGGGGGGGGNGG